jgi:nucleoredoxin
LQGKIVALYFSAHWCPPCRQFTPVLKVVFCFDWISNGIFLKDFYDELENEDFEIVFVSFDRSKEDLKKYLEEAHGDWYHIPYGDPQIQWVLSL